MAIWEMATSITPEKRGPTVFLSLSGKAQEAVLELGPAVLGATDGLNRLYEKLDSLFKIDTAQAALSTYAEFEKFLRPSSMSIADFNVEFDRMVQKLTEFEIKLPEAVLAHRVLKSANLSRENEKLIVATVKDATYSEMMTQIKKIMRVGQETLVSSSQQPIVCVKEEPFDISASESDKVVDGREGEELDVCYGNYQGRNWRGGYRRRNFRGFGGGNSSGNRYSKGQNTPGPDGKPSRC